MAKIWFESSRSMKLLSESIGTKYVHIIQPNYHYNSSQNVTIDPRYKFLSNYIPDGYNELLKQKKINKANYIYDLKDFFDSLSYTENYVDDCCHYTTRGYKKLHSEIIKFIK